MTTSSLPWKAVRYCLAALGESKTRSDAIQEIATKGQLAWSRATTYLDTAIALRLIVRDGKERWQLSIDAERPEQLLRASTLIRLFHRWQALGPQRPLDTLKEPLDCFGILGTTDMHLLQTAQSLALHLKGDLDEELSPEPALLLEMARLWAESREKATELPLFDAAEAFKVFDAFLRDTHVHDDNHAQSVERFVRACTSIWTKNLIRVSHVQYALGNDRRYAEFRTRQGFIKSLSRPTSCKGLAHAQPFQTKWKLVSSA